MTPSTDGSATGDPAALLRLLPEAALAVGFLAILAADLVLPASRRRAGTWLGVLACGAGLIAAWFGAAGAVERMLTVDGITALARPAILAVTAMVLLAGDGDHDRTGDQGAWAAMVTGLGLGGLVAASATNLITLWLGLEVVSQASYVLAAWRRGDRLAAEAGTKFVLFGGAASGLTLFGMSHVYGLTGHLDFAGIGTSFAAGMPAAVLAALGLAAVGIGYKLAVVPLHFYAPDVYQGAPALAVATISVVPKIAAAAALARGLQLAVPPGLVPAPAIGAGLAAIAAASLLAAAFTALVQKDAKRIVAFSGIGHAGAVLLALACLPRAGALGAAAFYLGAYAVANVGALLCLSVLERERGSCALPALAGCQSRRPWLTAALCLFLFSLAGIPPLAGFLAKWGVLQQTLQLGLSEPDRMSLLIASAALLVATVVSAWSYLLVVRAVLFQPLPANAPSAPPPPLQASTVAVLLLCGLATVGLGFWLDGSAMLAAVAVHR